METIITTDSLLSAARAYADAHPNGFTALFTVRNYAGGGNHNYAVRPITEGFAVAITGANGVPTMPTDAEGFGLVCLALGANGKIIGGWKNEETGEYLLDAVRTLSERDDALTLGRALSQKSIYDLTNGVEIPC